ncbi:hypothetical protein NUW54_g3495 [Trametes sanguinea]|uniref:Uncharacterized protein n=1 Tax=Trametes sanguinea TaxID=158606 RepID=A0ACC1Q466_9APHY|nr:hypothetical protein NUW54_g3495 [Trametes sanguinea]
MLRDQSKSVMTNIIEVYLYPKLTVWRSALDFYSSMHTPTSRGARGPFHLLSEETTTDADAISAHNGWGCANSEIRLLPHLLGSSGRAVTCNVTLGQLVASHVAPATSTSQQHATAVQGHHQDVDPLSLTSGRFFISSANIKRGFATENQPLTILNELYTGLAVAVLSWVSFAFNA